MAGRRNYEHKMMNQRLYEDRVGNLENMVNTDKRLKENFRSDDRVEQMRRNRARAEIELEMQAERQLEAMALTQKQKAFGEQADTHAYSVCCSIHRYE